VKRVLDERFDQIAKISNVHHRAKIEDCKINDQIFSLKRHGQRTMGKFDKVIFSTGRAGFNTLNNIMDNLEVDRQSPNISIGIRIEMPHYLLKPIYNIHKDFKFSKIYKGMKVKSFCFSSGISAGGRLKYCHYQSEFSRPVIFLDGHSHVETGIKSKAPTHGNFALLVQMPRSFDYNWLSTVFVEKYFQLSRGKPVVSSLASFLANYSEDDAPRTSVSDFVREDIRKLIPGDALIALRESVVEIMQRLSNLCGESIEQIISSSSVYAPDVEFFWPTVEVSSGFETSVPGFYVVGDSAGVAQGNVQAGISGISAAYDIMGKL